MLFCYSILQVSLWNFELFRMREKQIPVDQVEVKETITAFAWEPTGSRFCCLHGESPRISASFYKIHEKGKVELVSKYSRQPFSLLILYSFLRLFTGMSYFWGFFYRKSVIFNNTIGNTTDCRVGFSKPKIHVTKFKQAWL